MCLAACLHRAPCCGHDSKWPPEAKRDYGTGALGPYPPGWCIIGVLPLIVPGVIVSEGFNKLTTLDTDDQHVREEGRRGNSEREIGFKGANGFEPVPGCPVQSKSTSRLVSSVAKELQQKTREA